MGLYTSYDVSEYYDEPKQKVQTVQNNTTETSIKPIAPKVRKSLYDQAQEVATKKEKYNGVDFRTKYRVGQQVAIQGPNGVFRTKKGVIAEIVASNLMYVYMEDSYKDVNDNWLSDFVTDVDIIHTY